MDVQASYEILKTHKNSECHREWFNFHHRVCKLDPRSILGVKLLKTPEKAILTLYG